MCARVANIVEDTNHHQQWSHKSHFKKNYVGKRAQRKALVVISGQALSPERAPVLHNCSSSSPILQSSPTFTDNNCSSTAKCDHQSRQKKKNPSKKKEETKLKEQLQQLQQTLNSTWTDSGQTFNCLVAECHNCCQRRRRASTNGPVWTSSGHW